MLWRNLLMAAIVLLGASTALADYRKLIKQGNEAFAKGDYEAAIKAYREAEIEKPQEPLIEYNLGAALYGQAGFEDAVKRFTKALETQDEKFQADAYYNLGNSFFRADRFAEAINAYKKTLELNPEDTEAKYNLELARKRLKDQAQQQNQQQQEQQQNQQQEQNQEQQQDQQQQQQQQNQQQDQQDQQQQQQQQNQGGDEQQQEQQQQQMQQQQQGEQGEQKQQQDPQGGEQNKDQQKSSQAEEQKMSKEDAMRILRAINSDEKDLQKKVVRSKMKVPGYDPRRDW